MWLSGFACGVVYIEGASPNVLLRPFRSLVADEVVSALALDAGADGSSTGVDDEA
jgi:hypothetical protein